MIMQQAGRLQDALDLLVIDKEYVVDKVGWAFKHAELLLRMGKFDEAYGGE